MERVYYRPDFIYTASLFAVAIGVVGFLVFRSGLLPGDQGWGGALFFLAFGLFTIAMGFPHPGFGHVSFDRVSQAASILVLGPVDAAWINGLASFIYPWHRLRHGEPTAEVLIAAFNNAGLMSLVILACGFLYELLGGAIPLQSFDLQTIGLLFLLMLSMQFLNDLGMMVVLYLRDMDPRKVFNVFTIAIESLSVLCAIVVAVAYNTAPVVFLVLLLVVLSSGMLIIRQYAIMRHRLEALVAERTEALRVQANEFERQATHDKLTKLPNRRYADDYLQREVELAKRKDSSLTIALADVDHFKQINDRYSHAIGDRVLTRVAEILSARSRQSDLVARYGGEEFLLCFPDTDLAFAEQVCDQMRQAVEHADWSEIAAETGDEFRVTISFGLAVAHADSRCTTVLNEADVHLYRAKDEGRNRVISQ
ncbi:MAG: GGDEF domain-containing protein [Woeseiaceae bacterium]|nr:GGDEF domain-containing protein [Woeseiaceae bacterium]